MDRTPQALSPARTARRCRSQSCREKGTDLKCLRLCTLSTAGESRSPVLVVFVLTVLISECYLLTLNMIFVVRKVIDNYRRVIEA